MLVKGIGSWCVFVDYVKDNNYARFQDPRYHRYREKHYINSIYSTQTVDGRMGGRADERTES